MIKRDNNKTIFGRAIAPLGIALMLMLVINGAHAIKLYKWVDSNGNISYQDRPPPKNAKILQEREIKTDQPTPVVSQTLPVIVYTLDNCQRCDEVVAWLKARGVPMQARALQNDRDAQRQILDLGKGLTAPTLLIDELVLSDTSEASMISALRAAGYALTLPDAPEGSDAAEGSDASEGSGAALSDEELLEQLGADNEPAELDDRSGSTQTVE